MPLDLPVRVKQNGTEMGQNLCAWIRARDHERGALDARTWLLSLHLVLPAQAHSTQTAWMFQQDTPFLTTST